MIFIPYTVNPYEITVHAQEKKERKKEEKKSATGFNEKR